MLHELGDRFWRFWGVSSYMADAKQMAQAEALAALAAEYEARCAGSDSAESEGDEGEWDAGGSSAEEFEAHDDLREAETVEEEDKLRDLLFRAALHDAKVAEDASEAAALAV